MYWLGRPPYLRWLAAGVVLAVAVYMDMSGPPTEAYPFAAVATEPGIPVEVEWRLVPSGLLPAAGDLTGLPQAELEAGTPLVSGLLAPRDTVPSDWWAVPANIPPRAPAGSRVLVAMREPAGEVIGIVIEPSAVSTFGTQSSGLLAIPPDQALAVAAALAQQRATLLIEP